MISRIEEERPGVYEPQVVAHAISFLCGLILIFLGFCRLGWLIEFIPYPPINAFVTAASITIISTQLPTCLGIKSINTREAPYKVYINTLKGLPNAQLDASIGISSIILLFAIQQFCCKMEARQPKKKQMWGMLSSLRLTFTVLLYTFISWLVHRTAAEGREKFRIVGHIEKGFSHAGAPKMDTELWSLIAGELPAILIILIVEHIAIAKNFGREYGYTVIPSQEILAQGFANLLSPFVGGYVCTGSFGASAVLTKAGVKTPLAGLFSAMILILALYVLTSVFYYIPNAALAGLIIHATWNLVTPPHKLYKFWQYSPFEFLIWVIGVVLAIFIDLETSIYVGIALSFALLLIRMARTPATSHGRTRVRRIIRDYDTNTGTSIHSELSHSASTRYTSESEKHIFLPIPTSTSTPTAHNPTLKVEPVYPGIFIYRFAQPLNYTNQAHHTAHLLSHIYAHTRRTDASSAIPPHHRLWSDAPTALTHDSTSKPFLRAVVLDFSTVDVIDVTTVQGLIDMRETLARYAAPSAVGWHFAGVRNRWTRRALVSAGFGRPDLRGVKMGGWCPAYVVGVDGSAEVRSGSETTLGSGVCAGVGIKGGSEKGGNLGRMEAVYGVDRPFFHAELGDAVDAAVRDARREDDMGGRGECIGCEVGGEV